MQRLLLISLLLVLVAAVACAATARDELEMADGGSAEIGSVEQAPTSTLSPTTTHEPAATNTAAAPATPFISSLPNLGKAPDIRNEVWLNAEPMTLSDNLGKVVLVEFWTYT